MSNTLKVSIAVLCMTAFNFAQANDITNLDDSQKESISFLNGDPYQSPSDTGISGDILAMTNFGGELIVGGKFFTLDGMVASRIGRWDGSFWSSMASFPGGPEVYSLHEFNNELYAGTFLPTLFKWTGTAWQSVGPDLAPILDYGKIYAMETYNNDLIIAGAFNYDTLQPPNIAKWNGTTFDSLDVSPVRNIRDLLLYNGELVAGGYGISSWNGTTWNSVGTGITGAHPGSNAVVYALVEYNNWLIAAGYFDEAGGNEATNIARWNGSYWQKLNGTLNNTVYDVIVYDNMLIAAGAFKNSGVKQVSHIAFWDGADWSPLGEIDSTIHDLEIYNGKLVASGSFQTSGGGHIAYWDTTSSTWRPLSDIATDLSDNVYGQLPTEFSLVQNYPNPFNPSTTISYELSKKLHVQIDIINIKGQIVNSLLRETKRVGQHQIVWDGTSTDGQKVATGIYYYKLSTDEYSVTKKMLLLK